MSTQSNQETITALNILLADSYTLYLKTQNFHWNVKGPMFTTLHTLFETQYTDLAVAIDEIAERIRSLGASAPGSFSQFAALSNIREETGSPTAIEMIQALSADQQTIASSAKAVADAADTVDDLASADLATRRIDIHEKNSWMLLSHLEE